VLARGEAWTTVRTGDGDRLLGDDTNCRGGLMMGVFCGECLSSVGKSGVENEDMSRPLRSIILGDGIANEPVSGTKRCSIRIPARAKVCGDALAMPPRLA
jgi:hypothetical protein